MTYLQNIKIPLKDTRPEATGKAGNPGIELSDEEMEDVQDVQDLEEDWGRSNVRDAGHLDEVMADGHYLLYEEYTLQAWKSSNGFSSWFKSRRITRQRPYDLLSRRRECALI